MAKIVIRMGNIHFSLPLSLLTTQAMPALMAPVFIVTPRKPPMMSTNSATSIAPNSSPEFQTSTLPVASSMPYIPLMGPLSALASSFCGLDSTW